MSPTGPLYPGTAADGANGGVAWSNVNNVKVEDGVQATSGLIGPGGGGGVPNQLNATNFGFAIPSTAVIDGIKLEAKVQGPGNDSFGGAGGVYLLYNGGATLASNNPNAGSAWPSILTWITYGSATSLWGKVWTPADINHANFGASLSASLGSGTGGVSIDAVRVTVYWHTAPTDVPKRYLYKVYDNANNYLGNLPTPVSDFAYGQDINTGGAQLNIEVPVSIDTANLPNDVYVDAAGNPYTDEAAALNYTTEGQIPIMATGNSGTQVLIKNGNRVVVWEYSFYWPNGIAMFSGQMNRISAGFGGNAGDTIKIMVLSDGMDLDNLIARGAPFTYTTDQSQTSQNATDGINVSGGGKFSGYNLDGQSFRTGAVTNLGAITVMLNGTANVTIKVWDGPGQVTLLGSVTQSVSVGAATAIQFGFAVPIVVSASTNYFFSVEVDPGQSITIYYQNTDVYANGTRYQASYAGGSGGGSFGSVTGDLYFVTGSSSGSTTGTYTSQDPTTGMLKPIIDDYRARGGKINYATGSVDATGLSLTYTFNTNTIYEAIKAVLSVSSSGFYYYVDVGTNILYFKQSSSTADIVLTKGKHIEDLTLIATIENVKNQMLFSGGLISTTNLYKQYQSQTSINLYGIRLERQSDNRVTLAPTADAIGNSFISTNKDERYMTTLTILDKTMDITLLKPGKVIGFNGFGTFADNLLAQIVRVDYTPHEVTLQLGVIPKRLNLEFEKITRGLVAQQTVANPTAPS